MTRTLKIALTAGLALALLFVLAGSLALASLLPAMLAPAVIGLQAVAGYCTMDTIAQVWALDGQFDDGEV